MQEKDLEKNAAETNAEKASAETQETAENAEAKAAAEDAEAADANEAVEESKADADTKADAKSSAADKQIAELKDKYARLYAEFDNYRKRTDREKSQMYNMGARMVVEKILPVVDNFERALNSIPEEAKSTAVAEGIDRIYRQIQKVFDEMDVKPIEAVGSKFDPNLHNAVMTETEGDAEEDTVTEDLQKGYTFKGEVVRHSMVKVKK